MGNGKWLSHKNITLDSLPVYDPSGLSSNVCEVRDCGRTDTEVNHWLPRYLAEQSGLCSDDWPTSYLCREHHAQWHALVTPTVKSHA
jgi:hypothetical protein